MFTIVESCSFFPRVNSAAQGGLVTLVSFIRFLFYIYIKKEESDHYTKPCNARISGEKDLRLY